jgi:hypothetical protein
VVDPFTIEEAGLLIDAIHRDWGEAQADYEEFRFFTGLRPSEQIALLVSDCDVVRDGVGFASPRRTECGSAERRAADRANWHGSPPSPWIRHQYATRTRQTDATLWKY